jgi:hypothetical protein
MAEDLEELIGISSLSVNLRVSKVLKEKIIYLLLINSGAFLIHLFRYCFLILFSKKIMAVKTKNKQNKYLLFLERGEPCLEN